MPLDLDRNERDSGRFTREDALLNLSDRPSDDARDGRVGDPAVAHASPSPGGLGAGALATAAAHGSHLWSERARTAFAGFKSQSPAALIDRAGAQSRALAARVADAWGRVRPRLGLKSLYWRILIVNLSGLALTLVGILYLISQQDWLIEAKRESIQSQAQVIVDAIVREASNEDRGLGFPDPDRLLEGGRDQSFNPPPYGLQDFEFAIQPEKVAPILQRYSQSSGQRARIYARDGTMIYDSAGLSSRVSRRDLPEIGQSDSPMITSFWTRLDSLFMPNNLPVYKEIGRGNGRAYPEVVAALEGQSMPMLMVNDRGSHLVSVAMPIQRMKAVQGALLLSTRDGDIDGIRRKERHLITWIFVVASIATGMTALALAGTIARPMRKLSDAALAVKRNIGAAKDLPTFPDHKDEIGQMASAFRDMTVALYKRIELSEKFAADVAHELKNPVTAVRSATESLTYVTNEKDRQELLHNIQVDLKRLNKLITDISNFSRLDAELSLNESEPVDVTRLATGIAAAFNDMRGTGQNPKPVLIQIDNADFSAFPCEAQGDAASDAHAGTRDHCCLALDLQVHMRLFPDRPSC